MGLRKREYTDHETIITAKNMNDIQDAVIALEDGLFSVDNNRSGEVIAITDAAKRGFRSLNVFGKTTQDGTPTPDSPVNLVSAGDGGKIGIEVCGKNLLNIKSGTVDGFTITNNGGKIVISGANPSNYAMRLKLCEVKVCSGVQYCLSGGLSSDNMLVASKTINTFEIQSEGASGNYTATENVKLGVYMRVAAGQTLSNYTIYPQLEIGSVATEYEQYKGQLLSASTPNGLPGIPIASGGNYTDANGQQWICDEIDLARGVYVQRVSEYITPTFASSGTASGNVYLYSTFLFETINEMNTKVLSTHFGWVASGALADMSVGQMIVRDRTDHPVIYCASTIATESEFNAWVQENNVRFLSILAAPIVTPLSEEELAAYAALYTYKDNTTVTNDASAYMELEYVMDAKKYIDGLMTGTIIPATVE